MVDGWNRVQHSCTHLGSLPFFLIFLGGLAGLRLFLFFWLFFWFFFFFFPPEDDELELELELELESELELELLGTGGGTPEDAAVGSWSSLSPSDASHFKALAFGFGADVETCEVRFFVFLPELPVFKILTL